LQRQIPIPAIIQKAPAAPTKLQPTASVKHIIPTQPLDALDRPRRQSTHEKGLQPLKPRLPIKVGLS
jgi:hypothetical protein